VLLQFASNPDLEVKLNREGVKAFTQVSALSFPNNELKVAVAGQSENKISSSTHHRSKQKKEQEYLDCA
jgi:hypothetical protein